MKDKETGLPPNAVSALDEEWVFFKKWLQNCIDKYGSDSQLTLNKIREMVLVIDSWSVKRDDIILQQLGVK